VVRRIVRIERGGFTWRLCFLKEPDLNHLSFPDYHEKKKIWAGGCEVRAQKKH